MTERLLELINGRYPLTELDTGDMSCLRASGMTFTVRAFHAEGLGHVSVMRARGFFGLMKMDTLIVNPKDKDLPLYSYDRIYAMSNDTLIVELYDTILGDYSDAALSLVAAEYSDIPERDPGEHWYDSIKLASSISKKGKKKISARLDELALRHAEAYLASAPDAASNAEEKRRRAEDYVTGLLTHGGPSTDVFKRALGAETTERLFKELLFGV